MIIVTTPDVPGRRVERVLGLVRGNTIRGRHVGRDLQAIFRNLAGGEIREYTKMMAEAREQAIDRMVDEADALGAHAVLAVRFQTCEVMKGAAEMLCYGTAVTLSDGGSDRDG
jgi:uncharacterized protein YbjQ (UPF0145 family)